MNKLNLNILPLGKVLNKELKEGHKKEGILTRLGNIKDANEKQLQTIKDKRSKLVERIKQKNPI